MDANDSLAILLTINKNWESWPSSLDLTKKGIYKSPGIFL